MREIQYNRRINIKVWSKGAFYPVSDNFAQIIALIEVRGVLKTSCHWLFNGVKQNNPNVIFDCMIMA